MSFLLLHLGRTTYGTRDQPHTWKTVGQKGEFLPSQCIFIFIVSFFGYQHRASVRNDDDVLKFSVKNLCDHFGSCFVSFSSSYSSRKEGMLSQCALKHLCPHRWSRSSSFFKT